MSGLETQACVERSYQVGTSPLPYQFLVDDDEKHDQTSPVCSGSGPAPVGHLSGGCTDTKRDPKAALMQLEIVEHDAGTFLFHIQLIVTISIKKTGMWIRNVFGNQTTFIFINICIFCTNSDSYSDFKMTQFSRSSHPSLGLDIIFLLSLHIFS